VFKLGKLDKCNIKTVLLKTIERIFDSISLATSIIDPDKRAYTTETPATLPTFARCEDPTAE
jgi:hypothetical protein